MSLRRFCAALVLFGAPLTASVPAFAQAQEEGPTIDIVEVSGTIDLPIHRYLIERIDDAERRNVDLLVLHMDSLGMLKVPLGDSGAPSILERIRDASVPVAIHLGPRGAHAAGAVASLLPQADFASAGPSALIEVDGETLSAQEALDRDLIDFVMPGVSDLLLELHGKQAVVGPASEGTPSQPQETVTLDIPKDLATVRFWQPGPIRRLMHALAVPPLAYLLLTIGLMLLVFEASQPGFGVAGFTAVLLLAAATYAFTVLPASILGMSLLLLGNLLLWIDVVRDELKVPTAAGLVAFGAGSFLLLPRGDAMLSLPIWVSIGTTFAAFIFFGPIMTLVHRARRPIATGVKRKLIGEAGDVRSMLNPEGYVMIGGELWRARLEGAAGRLRVGERVTVTGVDGAVLLVTGTDTSAN